MFSLLKHQVSVNARPTHAKLLTSLKLIQQFTQVLRVFKVKIVSTRVRSVDSGGNNPDIQYYNHKIKFALKYIKYYLNMIILYKNTPSGTSLVATMESCLPWNTTVQLGTQLWLRRLATIQIPVPKCSGVDVLQNGVIK